MDNKPYKVGLTIGHDGKGVPYGGNGEAREDGTANHGFKNLKGNPHLLAQVPELTDDPALHALVDGINRSETGLVSVGCASWPVADDKGHRWSGYVEFAINTAEAIEDARSYFPLFFNFDKSLHDAGFNSAVNYHWELEGAHFWPANAVGFTCTVWVYTAYWPTFNEAKKAWQQALDPLIPFLGGYPLQDGRPLFTPETVVNIS